MPRSTLVLLAGHLVLAFSALTSWDRGPYEGAAILDAAEYLNAAQHGESVPLWTKSPLFPWMLGACLRLGLPASALGLAASSLTLLGIGALCRRAGHPRAAPWAMGMYALSGSALAMLVQPLEAVSTAALLVWGVVLSDGALGGALLAGAVLARASMLPVALLSLLRRPLRSWMGLAFGAALGLLAFGGRAWPEEGGLALRVGNGAQRSGFPDIRPGPAFDRLRYEPVFAAYAAGEDRVASDRHHLRLLAEEVGEDPPGALATLLRKAFLFWHRTEIATGADFRYGLRDFPLFALLVLSYGLVAPLALCGLLRSRSPLLCLPVLAVFLVNVVFLTSERYRFPALPFLCAAAGIFLTSRPRAPELLALGLLGVVFNLNLSGRALVVPGDGMALQGRQLLGTGRVEEALPILEKAVDLGDDPRARYDLGLAYERSGQLELAEAAYAEALRADPAFPQAGENLLALQIRMGKVDEARALAEALQSNPYAGLARLSRAALLQQLSPDADVGPLLAEGHRIMTLRSLADHQDQAAAWHAAELHRVAGDDPALERLMR